MNRLVLIDGHAVLYRAYHAIPPLSNKKGQPVNAVYGFISILLRVLGELKPEFLAIVFDTPEPTFRNKLSKVYQSQRPKADEEFISQIDIVKQVVTEMGIARFEKPGFEADDVIGTLALAATNAKLKTKNSKLITTTQNLNIDEVIIVTGDRDMLQLVNDRVKVYMPVKGISAAKLYGEEDVLEKFGVKASQIVDYKALVGDASDNYSGVDGVGPKTASLLISEFSTIENLYKHVVKVKSEKVKQMLIKCKDQAELAKKLAKIKTDAPVKFQLERCKLRNFDTPNVHKLFEELEFWSLITRLELNNKISRGSGIHDAVITPPIQSGSKTASGQITLF